MAQHPRAQRKFDIKTQGYGYTRVFSSYLLRSLDRWCIAFLSLSIIWKWSNSIHVEDFGRSNGSVFLFSLENGGDCSRGVEENIKCESGISRIIKMEVGSIGENVVIVLFNVYRESCQLDRVLMVTE